MNIRNYKIIDTLKKKLIQIGAKYQKEFAEIDETNQRLIDGEKVDVQDLHSEVRKAYSH